MVAAEDSVVEIRSPPASCIFPYIIPYLLNLVPDTSTMAFRVADISTLYALTAGPARLPEESRPFYFEDSQVVLQVSHRITEFTFPD
jgi:hypothetical protein